MERYPLVCSCSDLRKTITPGSFWNNWVIVFRENPISSATSPTVYVGLSLIRLIIVGRPAGALGPARQSVG